jgi:hypothetical protein
MEKRQRPVAHLLLLTSFSSFSGQAPDSISLFAEWPSPQYSDSSKPNAHSRDNCRSAGMRRWLVLGRGSAQRPVDVVLSAKSNADGSEVISRHQARIRAAPTSGSNNCGGGGGLAFMVEDLGSLNGVFVNRMRVGTDEGVQLQGGLIG